jgi:hypothetical protein
MLEGEMLSKSTLAQTNQWRKIHFIDFQQVFDLKQFYHEMKCQANVNRASGVHGGHLAPAISHAAEANVINVDDLRR